MARRITDLTKDAPIINKELQRIDLHQAQITELQTRLGILEKHTTQLRDTRQILSQNNLVFTWTGPSLALSWLAGYVQDSTLRNWPVVAGSLTLVASTVYWLAWNPAQQQMSSSTSLNTLLTGIQVGNSNSPSGNNLIVCSVLTGTAGETGTAGGGGSDSGGSGPSGKQYTDF